MIRRLATAFLFTTILGLASTQAASQKSVDKFAEFKGRFSGTASFVVSSSSPALTGTGTIAVSGPKNGKSLTLSFSGIITGGGSSAPYSNVITCTKNGSYTIQNGIFNLSGAPSASVSGKAIVKKKVIRGTGAFTLAGAPATTSFTIQSKTTGKKRTLTVNYIVANAFGTFPFQFVATGKVKK